MVLNQKQIFLGLNYSLVCSMELLPLSVTFLRASQIRVPDVRGHSFVTLTIKRACQLYHHVATSLRACVDPQADIVVLKKRPPVLQELN